MLAYRYPLIAREGWVWLFLVIVLASVTHFYFGLVSAPLWALVIFLVFLFRDPHRKIPALPLGIVCPVDGRITAIGKIYDAYLDRTAICISIKMSFFDVYSVHSPMEGKIIKQWQKLPRKIQPLTTVNSGDTATIDKVTIAKVNTELKVFAQSIQSDEGDDVVLVIEASALLPGPHCYVRGGELIGQGLLCGFLQFGTQVDGLVPESTHIDVKVGERVLAGTGIIATLVRTEAVSAIAKL